MGSAGKALSGWDEFQGLFLGFIIEFTAFDPPRNKQEGKSREAGEKQENLGGWGWIFWRGLAFPKILPAPANPEERLSFPKKIQAPTWKLQPPCARSQRLHPKFQPGIGKAANPILGPSGHLQALENCSFSCAWDPTVAAERQEKQELVPGAWNLIPLKSAGVFLRKE